MSKPKAVREPIQVYLDEPDRALLDAMSAKEAIPRSDVIRRALRRLSTELLGQDRPGASLSALVGSLDDSPGVPSDLAARHDEYLYAEGESAPRTGSR